MTRCRCGSAPCARWTPGCWTPSGSRAPPGTCPGSGTPPARSHTGRAAASGLPGKCEHANNLTLTLLLYFFYWTIFQNSQKIGLWLLKKQNIITFPTRTIDHPVFTLHSFHNLCTISETAGRNAKYMEWLFQHTRHPHSVGSGGQNKEYGQRLFRTGESELRVEGDGGQALYCHAPGIASFGI